MALSLASAVGSSPLARGLRAATLGDDPARGIIPARAGSTGGVNLQTFETEDHPRSRGVYPGSMRRISAKRGSSPLARGLRRESPPA